MPSPQTSKVILFTVVGLIATGLGVWWSLKQPAPALTATHSSTAASQPTAPIVSQSAQTQPNAQAADTLPADFWTQTFDTPDGKTLALSQYKGQPILLNFWASWCPPCVKEMPDLNRFQQDMKDKGWRVIGLAVDGPTPVREFLAKVPVTFDIGLAGFGGTELSQALGNTAGGLPFTVLIDAQGRIVHRKMGGTTYDDLIKWSQTH
ncbi:TlpA disulfide reductase family protein [Aquabacterium sp.]|uniref:TlpA disulfide reductase family protein n=1 Tax=Aquabacterium sp. TaxID=1872578 RepID=UPI002E351E83|nr:TlpA disulfide reductase family protein [Aquabacterium sp.]HEX5311923.1 TlpA disulfide reductase family protein [Aquabacterium sp.]